MAPPLSTAIQEYLAWLEIDRHRSPRTVWQYADDLRFFSDFAGGDAAMGSIDTINRELLRATSDAWARLGRKIATASRSADAERWPRPPASAGWSA